MSMSWHELQMNIDWASLAREELAFAQQTSFLSCTIHRLLLNEHAFMQRLSSV